jgi:hypothetical protein
MECLTHAITWPQGSLDEADDPAEAAQVDGDVRRTKSQKPILIYLAA